MSELLIERNGKTYKRVTRKARLDDYVTILSPFILPYTFGDLARVKTVFKNGAILVSGSIIGIKEDDYAVVEPIESIREVGERTAKEMFGDAPKEEPTPQLAGIHDSLASLAVEVTKLKSVINGLTGQLTPLQLAILNAENTPADVKLSLIVEAGRLEEQRKEIVKEAE